MKRLALAAIALSLLPAAGCHPGEPVSYERGELSRRLVSFAGAYCEYEPLRLALAVTNRSSEPVDIDLAQTSVCLIVHHITDNDEVLWRPIPLALWTTPRRIAPGETVDLKLSAPAEQARLTRPGRWVAVCKCYRQAAGARELLFATDEIILRCRAQPLTIPPGTGEEVVAFLRKLAAAEAHHYVSRYPAWTSVAQSDPMVLLLGLGDKAGPALVANLGHHRIRPAVIQLLADMRYAAAVPQLLDMLQLDDGTQDRLILTALARITGHPKGFEFYSRWSKIETKEEALGAYRAWTRENLPRD
ncbi:MAG TPA: hypothetical protein VNA25_14940 [Phycisphaerae bacterium]|nr:hypothetical protein [Phycisphaerae bacterium]